jgi:hypothetical protein
MKNKKNKKAEIATILTLGMILVGAVLTIATSFFANKTKNLASNPRACEIPNPNKAICFCQIIKEKGVIKVYASSKARQKNCMASTPKQYEDAHAYGAYSWGWCNDNGSDYEGLCPTGEPPAGPGGPTNTPSQKCAKEGEYSFSGLPCCDGLVVEVGSNYNVRRCVKKPTPSPGGGNPSSTPTNTPTSTKPSPGGGTPAGGITPISGGGQGCKIKNIASERAYYYCEGNLVCSEQSPNGICVTPTPTPTKIVTPGVTVQVMRSGRVVAIYDCGNPNLPPELKDGICKKEDGYTLDSDLTVVDENGKPYVISKGTRITKKDNEITVQFMTTRGKALCSLGYILGAIIIGGATVIVSGETTIPLLVGAMGSISIGTGGIVYCVTR